MAKVLWTQKQDVGPSARAGHALAYDAVRQRTVLFAGRAAGAVAQGDTWAWDGADWTQVADTGPDPRGEHAAAFDPVRGRVLVFGGEAAGATPLGDTWEWDGEFWTQVADTGPTARAGHTVVFDTARGRALLFGGKSAGPALHGDTWEWDGAAWTQVADTGPDPRSGHGACFDAVRGRMVVFGGEKAGPARLDDTWEWDGTAWTQVADNGPAPTRAPAMAFTGAATVLFGGVATTPTAADEVSRLSWEWDGDRWTLRQNMGPAPRWGHALAFDSDRGAAVLLGGVSVAPSDPAAADKVLGDTWEAPFEKPVPAIPAIVSFTVTPDTVQANVGGQQSVTVNVVLDGPAPPGGASIEISQAGGGVTLLIPTGETIGSQPFSLDGPFPPGDIEIDGHLGNQFVGALVHVA
jgi:Galactose oxidase, central domain